MTEDTTAPEAETPEATAEHTTTTEEPTGTPEATEDTNTEELPTDLDAARKLRSEAKNLRTRLRDTEGERDALTGRVDALTRQIVETSLPPGITPAAFWAAGNEPADLLTEDGAVDTEAVTAAARDAVEKFGLVRAPAPNPAQGSSGSGAGMGGDPWTAAFSRR